MLPEGRSFELSAELLRGAVDIHVHAGPHLKTSPRSVDPFQAAIQALEAGMASIVYMDVFEMSNGTSWIVNRVVKDIKTFGGINLNTVYDGVNPRAVKTALEYGDGAKYVAFGTHSTHWMTSREGQYVDGKWIPSHVRFQVQRRGTSSEHPNPRGRTITGDQGDPSTHRRPPRSLPNHWPHIPRGIRQTMRTGE